MSIMYHLQQRQEQVEFDLGVSTSASIDQMAGVVMFPSSIHSTSAKIP